MHYTGKLKGGGQFESSMDKGEPFKFRVGIGQVIRVGVSRCWSTDADYLPLLPNRFRAGMKV